MTTNLPEAAVDAAARAIAGRHWQTAMDDARAALTAALPHLATTVNGLDVHSWAAIALAKEEALEATHDRVTDLFEEWAAEENEHRRAGEYGLAEGLTIAINDLRDAIHGGGRRA